MECYIKFYGAILIVVLLLTGCTPGAEDASWYETKEKAISEGLEESVEGAKLLSTEEYKGETLVFFQSGGGLGIGNLVMKNNKFQFQRTGHMFGVDVQGDLPFSTIGTDFETKSGVTVSVLIGKVLEPTIKTLMLKGDGTPREIGPEKNSTLFYAIHEAPFHALEVVEKE